MSGPELEKVLCTRTSELPPGWLPEAGAVCLDEPALLAALETINPHWVPRTRAELDPPFKQWIPYLLLLSQHRELAAYPRRGAEARLHGLWSVGVGGHINPVDGLEPVGGQSRWRKLLWTGLRREMMEEYPAAAEGETRFLGLIHESQSGRSRFDESALIWLTWSHENSQHCHNEKPAQPPPQTRQTRGNDSHYRP